MLPAAATAFRYETPGIDDAAAPAGSSRGTSC